MSKSKTQRRGVKAFFISLLLAAGLFAAESMLLLTSVNFNFLLLSLFMFILLNIFPISVGTLGFKYRICSGGANLLSAFLFDMIFQFAAVFFYIYIKGEWNTKLFWFAVVIYVLSDFFVFWNGIIRIYVSSPILGLKMRIIGAVCGMIPIVNIIVLIRMLSLIYFDIDTELQRQFINDARHDEKVCATKYPFLLVHGVFFRDAHYLNYWGRIPEELKKNGAVIYYGNQQSALGIKESAEEIAAQIRKIVSETGCEKLNIIAHSKGGLDCRYAINHLGVDCFVQSLTTINTPHRGCEFADWLLDKAPYDLKMRVANIYNSSLRKIGDVSPDFLRAVNDLRATSCDAFNKENPDVPGIYYQSTASKINKPLRNIFPLNLTYAFVERFDGDNDGLVSAESAKWGENFIHISSKKAEGISHADMIDMSRHNRRDFDVLEFYVQLVSDLKKKGF